MGKNESNVDRLIRIILAVVAFAAAALIGFGSVAGIILVVVTLILLATAAIGFCPLYRLLGISTNK